MAEHAAGFAVAKGNPLVLNILKKPKAKDPEEKVTKLAIGKPGGIDAEQDKYTTTVQVYCHNCAKYLDHT